MGYALIGAAIFAFGLFIWWRYTSVARGARQRDERIALILAPLAEKLARKEQVSSDEVAGLAAKPHVRPMLYAMLKHFERLSLFPVERLEVKSQGEAQLSYWMMHPNELQDAPEQIELVESISRPVGPGGEDGAFLVFRYRMPQGHWAAKDGWLLGLAGPYFRNDSPYCGPAGAFSRSSDKQGEVKPAELVDWYIGVVTGKRK